MEAILVRLARAVACESRLRMLTLIVQMEETTPTALSNLLAMRIESVSNHLKELMAVGLITRRHAGPYAYVRSAAAYSLKTPSGRMAACLHERLRKVNTKNRETWDAALAEIFALATAFTHPRRLVLLSILAHGERSTTDLGMRFPMSGAALSRHCTKVIDRGFAVARRNSKKVLLSYQLPTKLHRSFWEVFIVPPPVAVAKVLT